MKEELGIRYCSRCRKRTMVAEIIITGTHHRIDLCANCLKESLDRLETYRKRLPDNLPHEKSQ